jgi:hypothetical protein
MIDKEKLVDVFMHMGDHIRSLDEYGFGYDSTLAEAIEDVVAMLKQPEAVLDYQASSSKWIPVSERLPEQGQEVIVYSGGVLKPTVFACQFWNKHYDSWARITHWMPLPEPPKEG